ncbi:hypothetical protein L596_025245 [Steinernema carpocapsae]|uniref:Uncharacterized protein n=1 Tax=Steinernema carpocapsae TaxID=34508 RepID=A0A4U5M787_STECR|nr:hypothetical protein L596_025245 [Steinernema carpocapsae]
MAVLPYASSPASSFDKQPISTRRVCDVHRLFRLRIKPIHFLAFGSFSGPPPASICLFQRPLLIAVSCRFFTALVFGPTTRREPSSEC